MFLTSFTVRNFLQLIFYLAVLVVVLFITYYITKWIAGYQKNVGGGCNFEIIETLKVTNNKFLQIVRVGKEDYYVIAIGKDEIHMLGKLTESQVSRVQAPPGQGGFGEILASFTKNKKGDKDED